MICIQVSICSYVHPSVRWSVETCMSKTRKRHIHRKRLLNPGFIASTRSLQDNAFTCIPHKPSILANRHCLLHSSQTHATNYLLPFCTSQPQLRNSTVFTCVLSNPITLSPPFSLAYSPHAIASQVRLGLVQTVEKGLN